MVKVTTEGEGVYVEYDRVLEGFAIGGHPLIPGDGVTLFKDRFNISVQPALRLRSGEVPERRSRVANPVFDEGVDKEDEGCREKREKREPNHLAYRSVEARGVYIIALTLRTVIEGAS